MKKLLRSRTEKWIGGVCGGLGKFFGMDSTIWRLIFIFGTIFGLGSFFLIYIVMWIAVPKEIKINTLDDIGKKDLKKV